MKRAATFAFVVSGAASLVFQVIWSRMLQHVFGATSVAVATVLAVFMAGLGLGAYLAARWVQQVRHPILAYAAAEFGIGLCGLVIPGLLRADGWLATVNGALHGRDALVVFMLRFACIVPVLIVPTTLMGATLPLLTRHFADVAAEPGAAGKLYAANTLGAVLGAFLGGFVLMPNLGLRVTNLTAVGANVVLAATVVVLWKRFARHAPAAPRPMEVVAHDGPRWRRTVAFGASALSGLAALAYEVLWTRAIVITVGSSVQAFSLILITCLLGIAAGSATATALLSQHGADRPFAKPWYLRAVAAGLCAVGCVLWFGLGGVVGAALLMALVACAAMLPLLDQGGTRPLTLVALLQLTVAVCAFVSFLFLDRLPTAFLDLVHLMPRPEAHVAAVRAAMFVVAAVVTFPATFAMGAMFPATMTVVSGGTFAASDVGRAYGANTVGAIAGAWLAGFLWMPWFGLPRTLLMVVLLNLSVALTVLLIAVRFTSEPVGRFRWLAPLIPLLAAAVYLAAWVPGAPLRWRPERGPVGVFRISQPVVSPGDVLFRHDGAATTVTLERTGKHIALRNNGKVDASNGGDMATQIGVAAYPLLLTPAGGRDAKVAVLGFGSGVSVGAALAFPVKQVDVVELEAGVVAASRYFARENHLSYEARPHIRVTTPRVAVHHDDGRNYLAATAERYDVIVSEPSNPWIAGVADLFTREHFRIAARALTDDGIYAQWLQLYELSPQNVKSVLRTFIDTFPYAMAVAAGPYSSDLVIIGSRRPLRLSYDAMAALLGEAALRERLAPAHLVTPADFLARMVFASRDELADFAGAAPINTDDNGHLEFTAPGDLIQAARFGNFSAQFYGARWPYGHITGAMLGGDNPGLPARWAETTRALLRVGRGATATATSARGSDPRTTHLVSLLTTDAHEPSPSFVDALAWLEAHAVTATERATLHALRESMASHRWDVASGAMDRLALDMATPVPSVRFLSGFLAYKAGLAERGECSDLLATFEDDESSYGAAHPEVFYFLARARWSEGDFDGAVGAMGRYLGAGDRP